MGRRVAVLHEGVLHQVGPPEEAYEHPADLMVAAGVRDGGLVLSTDGGRCRFPWPPSTCPRWSWASARSTCASAATSRRGAASRQWSSGRNCWAASGSSTCGPARRSWRGRALPLRTAW